MYGPDFFDDLARAVKTAAIGIAVIAFTLGLVVAVVVLS